MSDDRIFDAVNLFKFSDTGRGVLPRIAGVDVDAERYRKLSADIVQKLMELWATDEIGFHRIPNPNPRERTAGDAAERWGHDIRVDSGIEPSANRAAYCTAREQGKLAATSCIMVHEAGHLVRPENCLIEQEVLCRTIQSLYFSELQRGRPYGSRFVRRLLTSRYTPATNFYNWWEGFLNRLKSQDLVDQFIRLRSYQSDLEKSATADFISRSLAWWGGLTNRWRGTKGYYLRSLASQTRKDYAQAILKVLESIPRNEWAVARACAGDLQQIRDGLTKSQSMYNLDFGRRIQAVQRKLGENFGMQPAAVR